MAHNRFPLSVLRRTVGQMCLGTLGSQALWRQVCTVATPALLALPQWGQGCLLS